MSFHRITITLEVLCPDDDAAEAIQMMSLDQIHRAVTDGDCSGRTQMGNDEILTGKEAAQALLNQGSDPEFFQLDPDGNAIE